MIQEKRERQEGKWGPVDAFSVAREEKHYKASSGWEGGEHHVWSRVAFFPLTVETTRIPMLKGKTGKSFGNSLGKNVVQ